MSLLSLGEMWISKVYLGSWVQLHSLAETPQLPSPLCNPLFLSQPYLSSVSQPKSPLPNIPPTSRPLFPKPTIPHLATQPTLAKAQFSPVKRSHMRSEFIFSWCCTGDSLWIFHRGRWWTSEASYLTISTWVAQKPFFFHNFNLKLYSQSRNNRAALFLCILYQFDDKS
jgi:hypothetical protein